MKKNGEKLCKKNRRKYICEKCVFSSSDKHDFTRHLTTRKHNTDNEDNKWILNKTIFWCTICNKTYKYSSGLSKHKNKCHPTSDKNVPTIISPKIIVNEAVDSEKESLKEEVFELKKMMKKILNNQIQSASNLETLKDVIPNMGNTYNNRMSINIYLNE